MSLFWRINVSVRTLVHHVGPFGWKRFRKVHFKCMQMKTRFFHGLSILTPLKRAPTKSSLPALPPVQRRVLRFLRESRVRFRDGSHGSSLTASNTSALRSRLCYISWKKHVTWFNSNQSSTCSLISSVSGSDSEDTLIRVKTLFTQTHGRMKTQTDTRLFFIEYKYTTYIGII